MKWKTVNVRLSWIVIIGLAIWGIWQIVVSMTGHYEGSCCG